MNKRLIALALAAATMLSLFALPAGAATTTKATPKVVSKSVGSIGKITIPGTKVNNTIMVATDNKYFLDKNEKGKKDVNGAIFMDYRNRDLARRRNIVLYGHNMKSGKMFATLHSYTSKATFDKYSTINVELFNRKYEYQIVLVAQFNVKEFNHTRTQFKDNTEFKAFLDQAVAKAKYVRNGFVPTGSEDILTLSTCVSRTIKNYANYKWVVMAKRVKDNGLVNAVIK